MTSLALDPVATVNVTRDRVTRARTWTRTYGKQYTAAGIVTLIVLAVTGVIGLAVILVFIAATGSHLALERQRYGLGSRWFARRVWCLTGLAVLVPILLVVTGATAWHLSLLLVIGYAIVAKRLQPPEPPKTWHNNHEVISGALVKAGVYKPTDLPTVDMPGTAWTQGRGTCQTLRLPGRYWGDVAAKSPQLAAALGVPEHLVTVTHKRDQPADTFTLWVGEQEPVDLSPRVSPLATATVTRWDDPVIVGRNTDGDDVTVQTWEANLLLAGIMGMGKTVAARPLLTAFLLDPDARIYCLDGKGSQADYGPIRPHCVRFVSGVQEDAPTALAAMLTDVLDIVRARNSAPPTDRYDGVLLMLEELQDVRSAADKAERDEIDSLLGRIIRMGRAVGVVVAVSTQRPDVLDLPSGIRNLISQSIALKLRTADYRLVLGDTPKGLPMPTARGEAVLATPAGHTAILTDAFPPDEWRAVCARATRPVELTKSLPVEEPERPLTMLDVVLDMLAEGPLSASEMYELLPDDLRPASVVALGKTLGTCPGIRQHRLGNRREWRLDLSDGQVQEPSARSDGRVGANLTLTKVAP